MTGKGKLDQVAQTRFFLRSGLPSTRQNSNHKSIFSLTLLRVKILKTLTSHLSVDGRKRKFSNTMVSYITNIRHALWGMLTYFHWMGKTIQTELYHPRLNLSCNKSVNTDFWLDTRHTRELRHLLRNQFPLGRYNTHLVEMLLHKVKVSFLQQFFATWNNLICRETGLNIGGKTRNIAFQLVLQQVKKLLCMAWLPRYFIQSEVSIYATCWNFYLLQDRFEWGW